MAKRRVLEFVAYNPDYRVRDSDAESYAPVASAFRYQGLLAALRYPGNLRGTAEHRKKLRELSRRLRKLVEWVGEGDKEAFRLSPAGGEVLITQAELDLLRKCWEAFMLDAALDVEVSTDIDEYLDNVPERDKPEE